MLDTFLNKITMYRLLLYVLAIFSGLGILLAFTGRLSATPTELVVSMLLTTTGAYVVDRGLSRLLKVPTNRESALITGLILFLIIHPADSAAEAATLLLAGGISGAAKFFIAWNGKHIFNPAAFAATVVSLAGLQTTTWWIGSSALWPFTLLLGLLVVRKIRRFPLFLTFVAICVVVHLIMFVVAGEPLIDTMRHALFASPLIFLGTIMLTEPATMPPRRNLQMYYAALVALLYVTAWHVGPVTVTPAIALLIGNVFAFVVSPKLKIRMRLKAIEPVSARIGHYIFEPERTFSYLPGQYMEWTLAGVPYDSRGNRRTFTLASSPTESTVQIGLKFYEPSSAFKTKIAAMKPGDAVYAGQIAGNFTLRGNEHKKLAFVAGGIGVTPFRSMVKYLVDTKTKADVVLVYAVADPNEFAYDDVWEQAEPLGIKTVKVITNPQLKSAGILTASLDEKLLADVIPDYAERLFYVSGPNVMVNATKRNLRHLGVARTHIKTDYFAGY